MNIFDGIGAWVAERIRLDLNPLWHVIPRRFKISVRWDRPGAPVQLPSGFDGVILAVFETDDQPCPVALVQAFDEDCQNVGSAGWLPVSSLAPVPGSSFRETWHAMRGKESA